MVEILTIHLMLYQIQDMTHNLWVEEMKDKITVQRVQLKILLNTDKVQQPINRKQQDEEQLTIRMWNRVQHSNKLELQTMLNHQQQQLTHQEQLLEVKNNQEVDTLKQQPLQIMLVLLQLDIIF